MSRFLVTSVLSACAAAEFVETQEGVSLLQLAANKRNMNVAGETTDVSDSWGGRPFFICEQVKLGFKSNCTGSKIKEDRQWAKTATNSVRDCSIVANRTGADTFNFDLGRLCEPVSCGDADVRAVHPGGLPPDSPIPNGTNISIYSSFCGLSWVTRNFTSDTCGRGNPIYLGYHVFRNPPKKACKNALNFSSGVRYNNIHDGGAMVFADVLPGADLKVTADVFQSPIKDKTGMLHGFGILNLKTGTNTTFTFEFLKSNTNESKTISDFMVTLAELTTSRDCWNKAWVTAHGYSGYYLTSNPMLDVKAFPGSEQEAPYVTFMTSHAEKGKPKNGTITKQKHFDTSASLYYRNRNGFKFKVETLDSRWKAGALVRLGGQSLVKCN